MSFAAPDIFAEASFARRKDGARKILVIACGALAREVLALRLEHIDLACLPAQLHNHPQRIPEAMRAKIRANREAYDEILCLYGDCGTGGELDRVLAEEGVSRIEGAHCYEFYAGEEAFSKLAEDEPGHCVIEAPQCRLYVGHGISGATFAASVVSARFSSTHFLRPPLISFTLLCP